MDTLFFWVSKIAWIIVAPASVLVLWLVLSVALLMFDKVKLAKKSLYALTITVLIVGIFPIGKWMLAPLEYRFEANPKLPQRVDGIVVLSGSEDAKLSNYWQQAELNGAAERILMFMKLAQEYPNAQLVYTGGSPSLLNQQYKEADVAKKLMRDLGFDVSRIQFERNARNTAENAKLSFELVNPQPNENWLLITTAWHMPRSYGLFCQVGWNVLPYPVDHQVIAGSDQVRWAFARNLFDLNVAFKEWLGLTAYYLTGKTPALLPLDCEK